MRAYQFYALEPPPCLREREGERNECNRKRSGDAGSFECSEKNNRNKTTSPGDIGFINKNLSPLKIAYVT